MAEKTGKKERDYVRWFSEINKDSGTVAGGKGANLGEMYNIDMPVPPGFVITSEAYSYFISNIKNKINEIIDEIDVNNTKQLEEKAGKVRELIVKQEIPKDMEEEIIEAYEILNIDKQAVGASKNALSILKFSDPVFVAVRSSATAEDLADASFAGQQETFLNIKGRTNLIEAIKECFASLFTARAIYYRAKKGFENVLIAVVVQQMINSDKSGVIFSRNPVGDEEDIVIEAVFGLGEGIVSGRIKPDHYTVSREMGLIEKNIADKKIALTRDSGGNTKQVELSQDKSNEQVLENYEIKRLANYALELEEHYNKPQDIEFAIDSGKIYIVQTRPITTLGKTHEKREIKGREILSGLGASPGVGSGKVKIIREIEDLERIERGDILVTKMTNPDMVVSMQRASGIVTDEGGITSHAAIVSREMGIACVVGTEKATKLLKNGEEITVDGTNGKVYAGGIEEQEEEVKENLEKIEEKEILPVVPTKTSIKVMVDLPHYAERASKTKIKAVGLVRLEGIIAESGKHPYYFIGKEKEYEEIIFQGLNKIAEYFEELWVRTSDIRSDEYSKLEGAPQEKELNPMLGMHGIRASLKHPELLTAELRAMSRVSKKIGVMLPQVISVEELKEVKKIIQNEGIDNLIIGTMIETPAACQIIDSLCPEVDFISFGTNDLTQFTLAIDRGNEEVQYLYDEMHPAVLKQLEYVIRKCKKYNVETSICGQAGSRKEMVKFLVSQGIDSISVNADAAREISEYVRGLEYERDNKKQEEIEKDEEEFVGKQIQEGRREGEAREKAFEGREEFPHFEMGFDVFAEDFHEQNKEEIMSESPSRGEEETESEEKTELEERKELEHEEQDVIEQEEESEYTHEGETEEEHEEAFQASEEVTRPDESADSSAGAKKDEYKGDEEEFEGDKEEILDIF